MFIIELGQASKRIRSIARKNGIRNGLVALYTYYSPKYFPDNEILATVSNSTRAINIRAKDLK
jgi:hypothetical protein